MYWLQYGSRRTGIHPRVKKETSPTGCRRSIPRFILISFVDPVSYTTGTNYLQGRYKCVYPLRGPACLCAGGLLRLFFNDSPLTSTVYRASLMLNQKTYIPYAERSRLTLFGRLQSPTSNTTATFDGYQHLTSDSDEWIMPVVIPHSYGLEGDESAES